MTESRLEAIMKRRAARLGVTVEELLKADRESLHNPAPPATWIDDLNEIDWLAIDIRARHPAAEIKIDPPLHADGVWFLDVNMAHQKLVIQWWPQNEHFGVSQVGPESFYGIAPDEVFTTREQTLQRIVGFLATG